MHTRTNPTDTALQALLDSWLRAVRAQDIDAIGSHYTPDVLAFDAIVALQFVGRDAYLRHWQQCLEGCPQGMETFFELSDVRFTCDQTVAFSRALCHCGGIDPQGVTHSHWMRVTTGYRRTDDGWKIVHEHFSAPFDPVTMQVLTLSP